MLEKDIFNRYVPNKDKLMLYGFKNIDDNYFFEHTIMNNSFKIIIFISDNDVVGKIYDLDSGFEYNNFRIVDNCGGFAGDIKNIFCNLLTDIRDNCFDLKMFVSDQANRIGTLINDSYNDLPYYEWESTPDTGVFKHKMTKKWYAIIMNICRKKISFGDDNVDVINIKLAPDKIVKLLSEKGFYPAYHMNKKNWISIILDDTVDDDKIFSLIEESYLFASSKK